MVQRDLCFLDEDLVENYRNNYSRLSNEELLDLKEKINDTDFTEEALDASR